MSVDNLKSVISKKGGLAKNNRFQVLFTPPSQPLVGIDLEGIVGRLLSGESAGIQGICNAVWTDAVRTAYQTAIDAQGEN